MASHEIAIGPREDRAGIDFAALRRARRGRVFAAMEQLGLDACLFGRETNARYVAGQRRLWTSNTRAYLPTCIAIRRTGRVHVMTLSSSVEDAPEDLPSEDVYGRSFDAARLLGIYRALPGLPEAKRVGVDGLTVPTRDLIGHICPNAEIVAAEATMRELRRVKLPAEVDCIRVALAIAESSLQCTADLLRPGVTGQELQSRYLERMCTLGTSLFAQQGTFHPARPGAVPPFGTRAEPFTPGQLVVLSGGALWSGYEGSLARTWRCPDGDDPSAGQRALYSRWRELLARLLEQCRPGRSGAELVSAYQASGEPLPRGAFAYSVGLGHEGPIAGSGQGAYLDRRQVLAHDMVVALRPWVSDEQCGFLGEEVVRITGGAPERLTTMSHGPLSHAGSGLV
ncbi:MAG: M24 family metallopeptidase [Candidatus Binatia bacterium]|nr:M24 family metallopeptidase [Candidatus Binatia bacterium]